MAGLFDKLPIEEKEAFQTPPLVLALVGDSVFDLYVRAKYVREQAGTAHKIHEMAVRLVNAKSQAALAKRWMENLTERESQIFRRGRNAKSATVPKNMSVADYKYATAVEALIGYLYLIGNTARIEEILQDLPF